MKKIITALLLIVLFIGAYKYFEHKKQSFVLTGINGPVSLSAFKGEKLILYFGYTFCPDVCPTELAMMSSLLKDLGKPKDVKLVFISLDPQRDKDIKDVSEYVKFFYKDAIALLATPSELKKITKYFGVHYYKVELKDSAMKYSIAHSGEFYLINAKGKFIGSVKDLSKQMLYKKIASFVRG